MFAELAGTFKFGLDLRLWYEAISNLFVSSQLYLGRSGDKIMISILPAEESIMRGLCGSALILSVCQSPHPRGSSC